VWMNLFRVFGPKRSHRIAQNKSIQSIWRKWPSDLKPFKTQEKRCYKVGSRFLELRFHHACWSIYRGCSGIEGRERDALYREWSPRRVDTLRMHAGLNQTEMAAKLHIPKEKLIAYLKGIVRWVTARWRCCAIWPWLRNSSGKKPALSTGATAAPVPEV
jgi:hypothetical protein